MWQIVTVSVNLSLTGSCHFDAYSQAWFRLDLLSYMMCILYQSNKWNNIIAQLLKWFKDWVISKIQTIFHFSIKYNLKSLFLTNLLLFNFIKIPRLKILWIINIYGIVMLWWGNKLINSCLHNKFILCKWIWHITTHQPCAKHCNILY